MYYLLKLYIDYENIIKLICVKFLFGLRIYFKVLTSQIITIDQSVLLFVSVLKFLYCNYLVHKS